MVEEYIVEIGFDCVKDKLKDSYEAHLIRERLSEYITKENRINLSCTMAEEVDFEKLADYIRSDLIKDVQVRLFGDQHEREAARQTILSKSVDYANAHTALSRERAIRLVNKALEILRNFYKRRINRELRFIAAQIEDTVTQNTENLLNQQTSHITAAIDSSKNSVMQAIVEEARNQSFMSIDNNVQLLRAGHFSEVESNIASWFNTIGSQHILFPSFVYDYDNKSGKLYSKPTSAEAYEQYTPQITCTGTIQMNGQYLNKIDASTFEYANRHQFPIILNVQTARKYLGTHLDPIQSEAEDVIGESFVIPPAPFPPAFPCSISLNGTVIFDYILFRAEEILDDDTVILSNQEQTHCAFRLKLDANVHTEHLDFSINTVSASNKELLTFLKFTKEAPGSLLSIKVLSTGEEFAKGILGNAHYSSDLDTIDNEINFLEKVVSIENYFNVVLSIPEEIQANDFRAISYLSDLIAGNECSGGWSKLEFDLTISENFPQKILESEDILFVLSYVATISVPIYGEEYTLNAVRRFDCVKYQNLARLKEKVKVLDVGDPIKLTFLPGNGENGTWHDKLKTDE